MGFSANGDAYGCLAGALFGSISGAFDGTLLDFGGLFRLFIGLQRLVLGLITWF